MGHYAYRTVGSPQSPQCKQGKSFYSGWRRPWNRSTPSPESYFHSGCFGTTRVSTLSKLFETTVVSESHLTFNCGFWAEASILSFADESPNSR